MAAPAASRVVSDMVDRGLLERREDPSDRRAKTVSLTPTGRTLIDAISKRRIDEAGKIVPLDQLGVSPQCGFSSTHHGNNLTVEQEKAKLKLCIDTAREVWGSL